MEKKTYVAPELTVHGDVEKVTLGWRGISFTDLLEYGIVLPFWGNCERDDTCPVES